MKIIIYAIDFKDNLRFVGFDICGIISLGQEK